MMSGKLLNQCYDQAGHTLSCQISHGNHNEIIDLE